MPTPFGHAIGGLTAAFLINSAARRPHLTMPILVSSAALAVAPDLDILVGTHRAHTHSVGAIAAVGAVAWLVLRGRVSDAGSRAAVLTAAYASHALLDLFGRDTRIPRGLTALWPFSDTYYMSSVSIFGEVSRRYWLPGEFILSNLRALAWEMVVLMPVLFVAWAIWSKRTLTLKS